MENQAEVTKDPRAHAGKRTRKRVHGRAVAFTPTTLDPIVLMYKERYMQRLADFVRMGYTRYVQGSVRLDNAAALVRNFRDLYRVHADKDERYRRKLDGLGNAHVVFWRGADRKRVEWVLLVSVGTHPAERIEKLKDTFKHPITVTGYELVRLTRKRPQFDPNKLSPEKRPKWLAAATRAPEKGKLVLSWRYTLENEERWIQAITKACRSRNDLKIEQLWHCLHRAPGFGPVRDTTKKLVKLFRAEWHRRKPMTHRFPYAAARIRFVMRLPHEGQPLSAVIRAESQADKRAALEALGFEPSDVDPRAAAVGGCNVGGTGQAS